MIKNHPRQGIADANQEYVPGANAKHESENQADGWIPGHESHAGQENDVRPAQQKIDRDQANRQQCMAEDVAGSQE
jgi:hypothetical protein